MAAETLKPSQIYAGAIALMAVSWFVFNRVDEPAGARETSWSTAGDASGSSNLERLASGILDTVVAQESKQDATCWTTVRMIESFSVGLKFSAAAEIARIEGSRLLLYHLWRHVSERAPHRPLDEADVARSLPEQVAQEPPGSGVVDGAAIPVSKLELKDHHRTTES